MRVPILCRRPVSGLLVVAIVAVSAYGERAQAADSVEFSVVDDHGVPVRDGVLSLELISAADAAPPRPTAQSVERERRAVMDQIHRAFEPGVLSVQTGTRVDFPNSDQVRHSIYSFSPPRIFEIKLYRGFEAPPITFDRPGLVVLGCNIHDYMIGYIYVFDTPYSAVTDTQGHATADEVQEGRYRVQLRHPRVDESVLFETEIVVPTPATIRIELSHTPPPRPVPETKDDGLEGLFGWIDR